MKGVIVYKGKYGATEQYAQWAGKELALPVVAADEWKESIADYDYLVIGTSVYMGKLQISPWLKEHLSVLSTKKIFLFLVAGTPPEEKEKLNFYILSGVPEEIRRQCEVYFLPGRIIKKKLSWIDGFMLRMGARLTKDPVAKKNMLADYNHVKRENIAGLINSIRVFCTNPKEELQTA